MFQEARAMPCSPEDEPSGNEALEFVPPVEHGPGLRRAKLTIETYETCFRAMSVVLINGK